MKTRTLATVFALIFLPATFAIVSASSGCGAARETLKHELEASNYEITRSVAYAMKNAVDKCGNAAETDGSEPVITAPLMMGPPTQPPPGKYKLPGLVAGACGILSPQTVYQSDAQITAWRQVGPSSYPEYERGPATVTYTPDIDHTVYDGQGTAYGLHAQSDRTGIVFLFGVPFTATSAFAMSGCSFSGGALCWARGIAEVVIMSIVAVRVEGQIDKCG